MGRSIRVKVVPYALFDTLFALHNTYEVNTNFKLTATVTKEDGELWIYAEEVYTGSSVFDHTIRPLHSSPFDIILCTAPNNPKSVIVQEATPTCPSMQVSGSCDGTISAEGCCTCCNPESECCGTV